jgi:hypothetical protein
MSRDIQGATALTAPNVAMRSIADDIAPLVRIDSNEVLPDVRTPEQRRAYQSLHGDGGFTSWERIIRNAKPTNRADILKNGLVELFSVAERADVQPTEIADWAVRVGEIYEVADVDALQAIIVDAKARCSIGVQGTSSQSNRLRPLDLKEFLQLDIKTRGMVVDPIIPEKGLAMLYAPRGIGKTHVALGIGFAAATGTRFLNWSAPTPRRVLLVDGEMPAATLQERLASIVAGFAEASLDPDNIRILAADLIEAGGIGNLASPDVQAELDPWLEGIDLLIIDNLSSLTAVIRDNDAESRGPIQEWLLRLRRRGISVLIVHHAGKGVNNVAQADVRTYLTRAYLSGGQLIIRRLKALGSRFT